MDEHDQRVPFNTATGKASLPIKERLVFLEEDYENEQDERLTKDISVHEQQTQEEWHLIKNQDEIIDTYRQLMIQEAQEEICHRGCCREADYYDGVEHKFPQDVIIKKTGVHFTEDFLCVSRMPGMRQTA